MNRPELAKDTDAREILALYRAAAAQAKRTGHSHWDENYPSEETVRSDLAGGWLYVWREDGKIAAAITLLPAEEMEAEGVAWTRCAPRRGGLPLLPVARLAGQGPRQGLFPGRG